ncbi:glutathione binding-like protein [Xanthobacter sp. KR7-225]|uniref:glutathione binding-like protein n=1 Tax=Xanthobacter sp. KR7-225 TaxID=3156613 RepID=UPI0032B326F5
MARTKGAAASSANETEVRRDRGCAIGRIGTQASRPSGTAFLTEGPAIVQYLADLKPEAGLAPAVGTMARVRLQEWLNFITSEVHAGSMPLFNRALPEEALVIFRDRLFRRLDFIEVNLASRDYLVGDGFTVADAYLFTVLGWMKGFSIDFDRWPATAHYMRRIGARASVQAALAREAETSPVA